MRVNGEASDEVKALAAASVAHERILVARSRALGMGDERLSGLLDDAERLISIAKARGEGAVRRAAVRLGEGELPIVRRVDAAKAELRAATGT